MGRAHGPGPRACRLAMVQDYAAGPGPGPMGPAHGPMAPWAHGPMDPDFSSPHGGFLY